MLVERTDQSATLHQCPHRSLIFLLLHNDLLAVLLFLQTAGLESPTKLLLSLGKDPKDLAFRRVDDVSCLLKILWEA